MEFDQVRMKSDSDISFYHILTQIRIQILIFLKNKYKMDSLDLNSHSDIYSIYEIAFSYFLY